MSLRCARGIRMQFGRSPLGATRRTRWLGSNGTHNESHPTGPRGAVPATPMSKRLEKTMMFELHENERLKRA